MSRTKHFLDCPCRSCVDELIKDIENQAERIKAQDAILGEIRQWYNDKLAKEDLSDVALNALEG